MPRISSHSKEINLAWFPLLTFQTDASTRREASSPLSRRTELVLKGSSGADSKLELAGRTRGCGTLMHSRHAGSKGRPSSPVAAAMGPLSLRDSGPS